MDTFHTMKGYYEHKNFLKTDNFSHSTLVIPLLFKLKYLNIGKP